MQDRTKDIRVAASLLAQESSKPGPTLSAEGATAMEFLISNALVDLHTIARAQAKMSNLEPWRDPLLDPVRSKGKG